LYQALNQATKNGEIMGDERCVHPWTGKPVPATDACLIIKGVNPPLEIRIHNQPDALKVMREEYEKWRALYSCEMASTKTAPDSETAAGFCATCNSGR
jgi:hypothetical protein